MNARYRQLRIALAVAALAPLPALANGQLIFAHGEVSIVGPDGATRPGVKGVALRPGEHIVTGPTGLAQIKMPDGTFIGVRPASRVQLRTFAGTGAGTDLVLAAGTVRVLNLETADAVHPLPVHLQSLDGAQVLLRAADLETGKAAESAAGLLARLSAGTALAQTTQGALELKRHAVSSVTTTAVGSAPVTALPPIAIARTDPSRARPAAEPSAIARPANPGLGATSTGSLPGGSGALAGVAKPIDRAPSALVNTNFAQTVATSQLTRSKFAVPAK